MGNKKTTKNRRKLGTHNSKRSKVKGSTDVSTLTTILTSLEFSSLVDPMNSREKSYSAG